MVLTQLLKMLKPNTSFSASPSKHSNGSKHYSATHRNRSRRHRHPRSHRYRYRRSYRK